jgi:hypothetical protein
MMMLIIVMMMMMMILLTMRKMTREFHRGFRLHSNLLDMDDEEPLFVMELTSQEKARAREFPNGNGERDNANF